MTCDAAFSTEQDIILFPNRWARFPLRDVDPNDEDYQWQMAGPQGWTDYDTARPYSGFEVTLDGQNQPVLAEQVRYLEGFGLPAQQTVATGATQYLRA